ncbi:MULTISPECIES: TonB-dependent receptor [unclassified Bacteroides]|uniref:TonB-dependent receptor n=1 Tax=unclassified Bacteroides TaxID=2646097 RepID=UPI000E8164B2|nr:MULTISPECIES: TonB-dependent receptor [unclassified Bacteroides]RGN47441.1 TonB-dependent receptor [Bacteroides sp. OM05-12]RHR75065.1 TonB-dependent receptor [Bacteroides sp. AF16-49]
MKKTYTFLAAILFAIPFNATNIIPKDTTKVIDIEEVVVIASPKENTKLRQLPVAASLISQKEMQEYQINSLKGVSNLVPNFFIPDYGSRLTSAVYIRGIGARINTPSVGLYVDNIPYIDKSAFDFNFFDIERIDVLRGPQGTLYGRNTMGGLVKVHTRSPFSYQGTDIKLSAATYNNYSASLTHYHRISNQLAFSAGGFYEYKGGFFKNYAPSVNKKADELSAGGGRIRAIWLPNENLKLDFTVNYEYGDQGGYAYGQYDKATQQIAPIAYNDESTYRRGLLNAGVNIEYQANSFILSAVTGYQNLNDRMFLDQDFTEADIFNLTQKQKLNTISEEIILKSKPGKNWQWTTGAFGFYQWLNTDGPVTFKEEGVKNQIEYNINKIFQNIKSPIMSMQINNPELYIPGNFDTPVLSGAIYHQSTYNNLFIEGLSVTAGLRLDYEKTSMKYSSYNEPMDFDFSLSFAPGRPGMEYKNLLAKSRLSGEEKNDYLQLLPKFALQYDFNKQNNIYASVSKGYRSGGYNIQMFSDLIQGELKNAMIDALKEKMIDAEMPEERVDNILTQNITGYGESADIKESTIYKPEYSWNYEIGAHLTLFNNKLQADLAAFYMDTHDQQIAQFSENGFGRMTVNAGKSRSIGAEAALRTQITDAFSVHGAYGLTHATFRDYQSREKNADGELVTVSYNGNFVPFVPRHTLTVGGEYTFRFKKTAAFDYLSLNLYYSGAGKIYWTEQNDIEQKFYGTLNARVSTMLKGIQIDVWASNFLDKQYTAFYFESMGRSFMQKGRPRQFGIDLRYKF